MHPGRRGSTRLDVIKDGRIIEIFHPDNKQRVSFGRAGDSEIILDHPSCSRNHCVVFREPEGASWFLLDSGSIHGTFLNRKRLKPHEATPLNGGDQFTLGASSRRYVFTEEKEDVPAQKLTSAEERCLLWLESQNSGVLTRKSREKAGFYEATVTLQCPDQSGKMQTVTISTDHPVDSIEVARSLAFKKACLFIDRNQLLAEREDASDEDLRDFTAKGASARPGRGLLQPSNQDVLEEKRELQRDILNILDQLREPGKAEASASQDELDRLVYGYESQLQEARRAQLEARLGRLNERYSELETLSGPKGK